jgi:hypothetical protein
MKFIEYLLERHVHDEESWKGFKGFIKFILGIFLFPIYFPIIIVSQIFFAIWGLLTSSIKEK